VCQPGVFVGAVEEVFEQVFEERRLCDRLTTGRA
jgi:hypothetical protein